MNYEGSLERNRQATKNILAVYQKICDQRREHAENRLLNQALNHLFERLKYYTEYINLNWYTPEAYTRLVLTSMLSINGDVYPYLSGQNGYGWQAENFNYLLIAGTKWYKQHLYWPCIQYKKGTQMQLFKQ
jgi:hypothetical protein